MTTLMQLGSRCFRMTQLPWAPAAREASTYSCSLMDRICPRTCRAMDTQYSRPKTMKMDTMPAPRREISSLFDVATISLMATDSRMTISTSGRE